MTLSRKMGLGIGTLLVIFMFFGFISYLQTLFIKKDIKDITEVEEPISSAAYEMEINLIGTGFAVLGYLHDHDPKHLERIKKDKKDFEDFQTRYNKLSVTEKGKELGSKVEQGYDEFIALAHELIRIEDEQTRKIDLFIRNINKIDDILDDNIQAFIKRDDPQHDQKLRTSYEMEINAYEIASGVANYIRTRSDLIEARIHRDEQHFRKNFEEYKNLKLTPEEQQLTTKLGNLFDESVGFVKDIITMDRTKEKGLAKFVQLRRELDVVLDDEIQLLSHAGLYQAKDDAINAASRSSYVIAIALLLTLVIGTLGSILIVRGITRPLNQLVEVTGIAAKGDFSQRIEVRSGDEIGHLSGSFNRMLEELQKTTVSRDYVENILNSMGELLIVVSSDGKIEKVNPATCMLLGYTEDELFGQSYEKVLIGKDFNIDISAKGGMLVAESVYLSKNNESIPVRLTVSVIKDKNGLIAGKIFIARDITERKRAEKALLESEKRFRTLVEFSPVGIFLDDSDGNATYINDRCAELVGVPSEKALNLDWVPFIHEDDRERVTSRWADAVSKGISFSEDYRWVHPDGQIVWTHGEIAPVHDDKGNILVFIGTLIDITERKRAEESLKQLMHQHQLILDAAGEGIAGLDIEGRIIFANPAAVKTTGYTIDELIVQDLHELTHYRKPDGTPYPFEECPSYETLKKGISKDIRDEVFFRKDGTSFPVRYTSTPIIEGNEIKGAVVTFRDITERKRLEEQLRHSQKIEAVGQLTGGIAHDFNNILQAIIGYATVLQMKMYKEDPLKHHVDQILASTERASNLTRGLLAFSRKQVLNIQPVNLNEIIKTVEKLLLRLIGEDIELRTMLTDKELVIMADPGQIEQSLMNLATNARDAMPDGGILLIETGKIEIDEEYIKTHGYGEPGMYARISVTDTGAGMDEKTRERIFEPFFTTKETGKGTGLGLSMVYGIVKQHNGYINVYSESGRGTTFKIYLPLTKEKVIEIKPTEREPLIGGTETILLAEDDEGVRRFTKSMLEEFGYTVIEAVDGEEAVNKFIEHKARIEFILSDVILPKKSGKEVYEEIKKARPDIKALFMSGYTSNVIHKKGILEEGLDFVLKPISPTELLRKIRKVLER